MKFKHLFIFLLINNLAAKSWKEIFSEHDFIFKDISLQIIKDQQIAFAQGNSPAISNSKIKQIPIVENNEQLIDIREIENSRISMLPDSKPDKPFSSPDCNSGLPSASKIRKEVYWRLQEMLNYLDVYAEIFGYKKEKIIIKVFEGLRDLKTQEKLFKNKFDEIKLKNPNLKDEEIEIETAKWVSPVKNNIPVHSTGAAIDIRLWNNETNDFVDLGKFGVIWGENKEAQTFSENISDAQKMNRLYLLIAATKAGLVNYSYEYWHFSFGDRYFEFWTTNEQQRCAKYSSIS